MAVTGQRSLVRRMRRISEGVGEVISGEEAKALLIRRVRARFEAETAPDGSPWAALRPKTIANKKNLGVPKPNKKLFRWGALRNAIAVIGGSNLGLLAASTGLGFRVGVNDPEVAKYARHQQYGTPRMVARPFMGLSPLDIRAYRDGATRRLRRLVEVGSV